MRTILRFSLNGDDGGLTTWLRNNLERRGFHKTLSKTSTYESDSASEPEISEAVAEFWRSLNQHVTEGGAARLDHFWMYVDQVAPARGALLSELPIELDDIVD